MIGRTSSAAWVKGVADMMSAQGLDTRSLFAQAGIDIAVLQDPAARIPADAMSQVWELAVAQSGNSHLGLDRPLAARYGYLGPGADVAAWPADAWIDQPPQLLNLLLAA